MQSKHAKNAVPVADVSDQERRRGEQQLGDLKNNKSLGKKKLYLRLQ